MRARCHQPRPRFDAGPVVVLLALQDANVVVRGVFEKAEFARTFIWHGDVIGEAVRGDGAIGAPKTNAAVNPSHHER
jgi:hypothetical protein